MSKIICNSLLTPQNNNHIMKKNNLMGRREMKKIFAIIMTTGIIFVCLFTTTNNLVKSENVSDLIICGDIKDYEITYIEYEYFQRYNNSLYNKYIEREEIKNKYEYYNPKLESIIEMNDFNSNSTYILADFYPKGYIIINRETGTVLETSSLTNSPYYKYIDKDLYYAGPSNYFYKYKDDIINIENKMMLEEKDKNYYKDLTKIIIEEDHRQSKFQSNEELKKYEFSNSAKYTIGEPVFWTDGLEVLYFPLLSPRFLDEDSFIENNQDCFFGYNTNTFLKNSCAQVAMGMLLQWYDRAELQYTVPAGVNLHSVFENLDPNGYNHNSFAGSAGETYRRAVELQKYLIFITKGDYNPGATLSGGIETAFNDYFDIISNNNVTVSKSSLSWGNLIRNGIVDGNPGLVTSILAGGHSGEDYVSANGHTFLVYGFQWIGVNSNGAGIYEYYAHMGWRGDGSVAYSCVTISSIFAQGAVNLSFN